MNRKELLSQCGEAYDENDFKRLLKLSEEVLKIDPENPIARSYRSISHCFLGNPQKALDILAEARSAHPKNHYHRNIEAMAYYDLGEYEKSIESSDEGLKIRDFEWLYENRIKALIKLDRIDEAIECYENAPLDSEIYDLLIEGGKCSDALKYCLEEDLENYESIVDKIKEINPREAGDYYISWIYAIKSKSDIRHCPDCGGDLIPIVWGYPDSDLLEKAGRKEIYLGGCCIPINNPNYHCKKCGGNFDLGYQGLHIRCSDYKIYEYVEYKIRELVGHLRRTSLVFIKSLKTLKDELRGYDDEEFEAFIDHLLDLGYLIRPREGYVKLAGFEDFRCAKEYPDDGKFAAPRWLAFPGFSAGSMCWRMGAGEDYSMNHLSLSKECEELFPMPRYWEYDIHGRIGGPQPPLGFFWSDDGKPKYPKVSDGIEVNGFMTPDDEGEFSSDTFTFRSISQALSVSKRLYLERYSNLVSERDWDEYEYSVLLNACYFKIMQDEDLKKRILETGDEPLIYVSDDGENLFGRALMELRDEIRRICKNENLIDWEYTEYLKHRPWWI